MKKIVIAIVLTTWCMSAYASPNKVIGKWVGKSHFQANMFCFKTYQCWPENPTMHSPEKKLHKTANKLIQGVCVAGSGALNQCECVTQEPIEQCQYWFE